MGYGLKVVGAALAAVCALASVALAQVPLPASEYRLASVDVAIADDATIDWYDPSDAAYPLERDFIRQIFSDAASEAATPVLTGGRDADLRIVVTYFDILSNFETLFCCAANEVEATFSLLDAESGAEVAPPTSLEFDHVGRGGLLAALAATAGEDQISHLADIIRDRSSDWLRAQFSPN